MLRRCVPVVAAPDPYRSSGTGGALALWSPPPPPRDRTELFRGAGFGRSGMTWWCRGRLTSLWSMQRGRSAGQERGPSPLVMERFQSVISQLFQHRIIRCGGPVEDDMANIIVAQLLYLDAIDPTKDIIMYVNSPGGSVTAGMAIFDTMKHIRPDVSTVCIGLAASMGAFLLSTGTKGKRYSLPNSRIMIHQPLGGAQGQETDLEIQANEMLHHKANLNRYLAYHTGSAPRCLSSLLLPEAGKTLSVRKWQAAFSPDGCLDIASVLSRIQRGGVHPTVRGEVWEFLLGCFDPRSTFDEREEIRQIRRYLPSLKSTWCAILVILKKYLSIYYL